MIDTNHQGMLARLLAKENLKIIHGDFPTAFFNPKDRVLGLPIWKDRGKDVYDLLVGHEVGHALYTPETWSHDGKVSDIPPSFLNVIEDIRIERKIQNNYPGLSYSFKKAYKTLIDENFFGELDNFDDLEFMDRLNIKSKARDLVDIKFDSEEKYYFDLAFTPETWDDVLRVSKELYEWIKTKKKEEKEQNSTDDNQNSSEQNFKSESSNQNQLEQKSDKEETNIESSTEKDSNEEETDVESDTNDISVSTDENFRKNENKLNNNHDVEGKLAYYSKIDYADFEKSFVGWKDVINARSKKELISRQNILFKHYGEKVNSEYSEFIAESKKLSSTMAKEFEIKKAATNYSRASISNTGVIDTNKLHSYMLEDDIFLKVTNIPNSKNHGLFMLVDYSISMSKNLHNVIRQAITLSQYCKKIGIPFEVYGFTGEESGAIAYNEYERDKPLMYRNMIFSILSSEMPNKTYDESIKNLFYRSYIAFVDGSNYYNAISSEIEQIKATPTIQTLLSMYYLIPRFKAKYNIENMNMVILTDGDPNLFMTHNNPGYFMRDNVIIDTPLSRITIKSKKNSYSTQIYDNITKNIIADIKKQFKCTVLGFFVSNTRSALNSMISKMSNYDKDTRIKINKEISKNGIAYQNNCFGYDRFYLIKAAKNLNEEAELVIDDLTKGKIKKAFSKYTKSKKTNKIFATAVSEMIAA